LKIKVIERGETEFTASTEWTEPDIRAALASDDKDGNVRSAIFDTTDGERDTDSDQYITVTEDDGTVLWSGWLSGHLKDKSAPDAHRDALAEIAAIFDDDPLMTGDLLAIVPGQETAEDIALMSVRAIARRALGRDLAAPHGSAGNAGQPS
jgi:hypothetical protein